MGWTAERGGSGEDAVVEVEQAGLGAPNDAKLYLSGDLDGACSEQKDILQGVVEHQSRQWLTSAAASLPCQGLFRRRRRPMREFTLIRVNSGLNREHVRESESHRYLLPRFAQHILHRPRAVLKKANHPAKGTWAEAGPGAYEAILSCWQNKAGNSSKHGMSPKAREPMEWVVLPDRKLNSESLASQLIEAFPREADEAIRDDRRL